MKRPIPKFKDFDLSFLSEFRPFLLGVATILVALYHSGIRFRSVDGQGLRHILYIISFYLYTIKGLGQIGVDMFLFLSSLGLFYSLKKDGDIKSFYSRRFKRVLPEMLVFILLYETYKGRNLWAILRTIAGISFFQNGNLSYWFFYLIIFLYLIYPFVFRLQEKYGKRIDLALIAICILFNFLSSKAFPDFFNNIEIALRRIPAFLCGSYFAQEIYESRILNGITVIVVSLLSFIISYRILLIDDISTYIAFRYLLSVNGIALIFILSIIMSVISDKRVHIPRAVEYVGKHSLEFYLIYEKLVLEMKNYLDNSLFNAILCFVICLIVSAIIRQLSRKLFS